MESTKSNKNKIKQKKLEIKTIIDDFRELIEIYGSNYDEKTVNTLKKCLAKEEDLWCDEEDDNIEELNNCIEYLNSLKNRYFGEYQTERPNLIFDYFIKTAEWIKHKKYTINPQTKDNKCFQNSIVVSLYHKKSTIIQKE